VASLHPPDSLHRHLIAELADELDCDTDLVAEVYLREVDGLSRDARLPDFVPVLAARHTRERLRRHSRR
jgi:hypothetical protein